MFSNNLETVQNNRNFDNDLEINDYWEIISKDIIDTARKYVPKVRKTMRKPVLYWIDDCTQAITERKRDKRNVYNEYITDEQKAEALVNTFDYLVGAYE